MSNRTVSRRLKSALMALAVIAGLALLLVNFRTGTQTKVSAAPDAPQQQPSAVTAKIEELHQRAAARHAGNDDDDRSVLQLVSPEQAVQLAQQTAESLGLGDMVSVELQSQHGAPVYVVQFKTKAISIDAITGKVLPVR